MPLQKIILKVICSLSFISNIVSAAINFNISETFVFLILGQYNFSGLKYGKVISKPFYCILNVNISRIVIFV